MLANFSTPYIIFFDNKDVKIVVNFLGTEDGVKAVENPAHDAVPKSRINYSGCRLARGRQGAPSPRNLSPEAGPKDGRRSLDIYFCLFS